MTQVLVTNDDGIDCQGIRHLALAARDAGLTVTVAAPAVEASGSSASIKLEEHDGRVQLTERRLIGLDGVAAFAVDAPPGLITLVATGGAFGARPDVVLSGINRGANTGHVVLHSGTVGAALTAAANGLSALAVSLDVGFTPNGVPHWATAASIAKDLLPALAAAAKPTVLNVNVPDVDLARVRGVRAATLAAFGSVQTNIEVGDGFVQMTVADSGADLEPGTDAAWLADGYATVTALHATCELPLPGSLVELTWENSGSAR